jgi:hypothetical protein
MQKGTADEAYFQVEGKTELVNRARVEFRRKVREIDRLLEDITRSPVFRTGMSGNREIVEDARILHQRLLPNAYDNLLNRMESNLQQALDATNPTRAQLTGVIGTQYGLPGATTSTVRSFGEPKTFHAPGGPTALIADFAGLNTKPVGNFPPGPRPEGVRGTMGKGRKRQRRTRRRSTQK